MFSVARAPYNPRKTKFIVKSSFGIKDFFFNPKFEILIIEC